MFLFSFFIIGIASLVHGLGPVTCQAVAPAQQNLSHVRTAQLSVPGLPFGIVYASKQPNIAFVALNVGSKNSSLGVLDTTTFPPSLQHQISIPPKYLSGGGGAFGVALSHDGQYLIAAASLGGVIFDTSKAATGSANAIVGFLDGATSMQSPGDAAIEVTISPDDKYAFVSQEYGLSEASPGNLDVFALSNGTGNAVGFLNLGYAVVGTALSPDGKTLYATSEQQAPNTRQGIVSVIDVATLEQTPAKALSSNASAGCAPVRVIVSSDGSTVWVTARESNQLLAFDADKLESDPDNALIASVQVGTAPVGLTFANNETMILTADSNRFNYANATTGLSVVDVQAALAGKPAVLGRIATGKFPREFATSPDGKTILVSDFTSKQVQAVDVTTLTSGLNNGTQGNGTQSNGTQSNGTQSSGTQSNGTQGSGTQGNGAQSTGATSQASSMCKSAAFALCIAVIMIPFLHL